MEQTHHSKPLRVSRNAQEYIIPSVWIILGVLNFILYAFINRQVKYHLVVAIVWLILVFLNIAFLVYKIAVPIMRFDGKLIIVFSGIFKKTLIQPEDIKAVRVYKYTAKTIMTYKQIRRINVILIELKNGEVLTIKNNVLAESVREKIATFLGSFKLSLETIDTDQ